ncbi:Uncharacterised protein [Mycobacterium tuberculosis]|nr:Uncharacterised protein [Mycobacterium tuberculosis]
MLRAIQSVSSARLSGGNALPRTSCCNTRAMACGVVVSRSSPGGSRFNSGSSASNRLTVSPKLRR